MFLSPSYTVEIGGNFSFFPLSIKILSQFFPLLISSFLFPFYLFLLLFIIFIQVLKTISLRLRSFIPPFFPLFPLFISCNFFHPSL